MSFLKSLLLCLGLLCSITSFSQTDTTQPPYKRFPSLPPFQLLLGDSATMYTKKALPKNKPVLLLLFSPDCSHCQHAAEEMVQHKDKLKNIQIVMATMQSISQMNAFAETYGLKALPNVVLGKDIYFVLPSFYGVHNLPYMAFYKWNGKLISTFEGGLPMEKVINVFENARR
jgi:thioredoxin-related protein